MCRGFTRNKTGWLAVGLGVSVYGAIKKSVFLESLETGFIIAIRQDKRVRIGESAEVSNGTAPPNKELARLG